MMKWFSISALLLTLALTVGCLQTRSSARDGEQRQVLQSQVSTLQKNNADVGSRFADIEEQVRFLNGRTEVLENKMASVSNDSEMIRRNSVEVLQSQNQKIQIFQEALTKMEQEQAMLRAELASFRAQQQMAQAQQIAQQKEAQKAAAASKNPFENAENLFAKKDFRQAILEYQRYREKSSKGKNFAEATYKIGLSFQELGMKDEAKSFYEEVIAKFPKTEAAKKSKSRLQKIK